MVGALPGGPTANLQRNASGRRLHVLQALRGPPHHCCALQQLSVTQGVASSPVCLQAVRGPVCLQAEALPALIMVLRANQLIATEYQNCTPLAQAVRGLPHHRRAADDGACGAAPVRPARRGRHHGGWRVELHMLGCTVEKRHCARPHVLHSGGGTAWPSSWWMAGGAGGNPASCSAGEKYRDPYAGIVILSFLSLHQRRQVHEPKQSFYNKVL